ncbi:NHL repeat-containing protein [Micromonospora musae]|uniref:NHL repeat-containing protein n=1 Tax=Micromonospora musae TaxID=1894970 RepID=UPI0033EE9576
MTAVAQSIGVWGNKDRGFAHPVDACLDEATGHLLVLNRSTSWASPHGRAVRISVLNRPAPDADVVAEFAFHGSETGQLMAPVALAADGTGRIAVTDEHSHTVTVFGSDGRFISRIGGPGTAPGLFDHPAGIAADPDGIWVADAGNDRLQRLTWDGAPIAVVGSTGLGPGQFRRPWMVNADPEGNLWVADWGNDRIQVLDPQGACRQALGSPGGEPFLRPSAVLPMPDGGFVVSDWAHRCIHRFDQRMRRIGVWYGSAALSPWGQERLDQFDTIAERRDAAADPAGEQLMGRPGGLCALPDGNVLVADTAHHRLHVYPRV